jgi:peptidoglycan/xylan/chitin deacetylase (PgdA/CDA1 family)
MLKRLLPFFYAVCGWAGITRIFYALNRRRLLIVTYHNIIPDDLFDDALHLGVSHRLSEFQQQLDLLTARFKLTTDLLSTDPASCVVTFDDGYRNNLTAAECLEKKGARGIFFVPVEPLISGRTLVIDEVLRWFSYVPEGEYIVGPAVVEIREGQRAEAYSNFYDWILRNVGEWEKLPVLLDAAYSFAKLNKLSERYEDLRFHPMNESELARLRDTGHVVGCHSYNHRPLAALTDVEMRRDFESCRTHRQIFNRNVFSFPFGGVDEVDRRAIELCKDFGYTAAVSNVSDSDQGGVMSLPRIALPHSVNRHVLDARLSGLESFIKRLIQ